MNEPVIIQAANGCTATLYCGDCMEILPTLGKVDAVVTDPPYGIGFKYESHIDSPEGYGEWLWRIIEQCEGKCSNGAPIFVFQAMINVRSFSKWFPRDWRIYAAAKNFVQMRPCVMQYAFDPVVCWWKDGEKWTEGGNSRDFYVANTAGRISDTSNIEKGHPCPRPEDQMSILIREWVKPACTVLDPFMGSGTTGVAALKLGRNFIGIEIEPKYFDIARRRIEAAASVIQQPLFSEVRR